MAETKTYKFSDLGEARFGKRIDAQTLGEELQKFNGPDGFKPRTIAEAAAPRRHVLHKFFEWDNDKAGPLYRIIQARQLIAAIRIVSVEDEDEDAGRAFYSVPNHPRRYHDVESIRNSASLQMRLLEQADRELLAMRHRYSTIGTVCEAVDDARKKIAARMEEHRMQA
jgi:hypothetical protein